jgi:hypothetical protein
MSDDLKFESYLAWPELGSVAIRIRVCILVLCTAVLLLAGPGVKRDFLPRENIRIASGLPSDWNDCFQACRIRFPKEMFISVFYSDRNKRFIKAHYGDGDRERLTIYFFPNKEDCHDMFNELYNQRGALNGPGSILEDKTEGVDIGDIHFTHYLFRYKFANPRNGYNTEAFNAWRAELEFGELVVFSQYQINVGFPEEYRKHLRMVDKFLSGGNIIILPSDQQKHMPRAVEAIR